MKVKLDVYVETGQRLTLAGAIDWPGWCRVGRDEASALQALFDFAPRYAHVVRAARLGYEPPSNLAELVVVERLDGGGTTDIGAPEKSTSSDARPVGGDDLERYRMVLKACWKAFDRAVKKAEGKELRKGPRGGGRDLKKLVDHVVEAEGYYLGALGVKFRRGEAGDQGKRLAATRKAILAGLEAAARGETPKRGPRGGLRWTPRYFVRRVAYHVLDHTWELEDRILPE